MHGILFDLDETLIDRTATLREFAASLWARSRRRTSLDEAAFIETFLRIDDTGYRPRDVFFADAGRLAGLDAEEFTAIYQDEVPARSSRSPSPG